MKVLTLSTTNCCYIACRFKLMQASLTNALYMTTEISCMDMPRQSMELRNYKQTSRPCAGHTFRPPAGQTSRLPTARNHGRYNRLLLGRRLAEHRHPVRSTPAAVHSAHWEQSLSRPYRLRQPFLSPLLSSCSSSSCASAPRYGPQIESTR